MLTSENIAIVLAAIAGIVWLVRLEGRVNTGEKTDAANAEAARLALAAVSEALSKAVAAVADTTSKADESLRLDIVAIKAAQVAREAKHDQMNENLIRVQEQLKHLTSLFERHFVEPQPAPPTPRRRTPTS